MAALKEDFRPRYSQYLKRQLLRGFVFGLILSPVAVIAAAGTAVQLGVKGYALIVPAFTLLAAAWFTFYGVVQGWLVGSGSRWQRHRFDRWTLTDDALIGALGSEDSDYQSIDFDLISQVKPHYLWGLRLILTDGRQQILWFLPEQDKTRKQLEAAIAG